MGSGSKACNVILRVCELMCASIVCGIAGYYLHLVNDANAGYNSRMLYAVVLAGISIFFSVILLPPLTYAFAAFPLDFAIFICWMVCFGLMANLTAGDGCNSYWMWHNWGYYWGGWWRTVPVVRVTPAIVTTTYCANWRASLAFAFIGGIFWFGSGCLGPYAIAARRHRDREIQPINTTEPGETSEPKRQNYP